MIDFKNECEAIIENNLLDSILFYFQEYPNKKEEFSTECVNALKNLLKNIKKEIDSAEDM